MRWSFDSASAMRRSSSPLPLQQQHFEQVAHRFGVADDEWRVGLVAKALTASAGGFKDGQFRPGRGPNTRRPPRERARVVQQLDQQARLAASAGPRKFGSMRA